MRADDSKDSPASQAPESRKQGLRPNIQTLVRRFQNVEVPLVRPLAPPAEAVAEVATFAQQPPERLFPHVRCPEGAVAGLLLFAGEWSQAHELVDDRETPDGCYWHALIHRMEPDTANSDYWFRQVGRHALFPLVLEAARGLARKHPDVGLRLASEWNPSIFNAWCEEAREKPEEKRSQVVAAIHSAECHLLWNYSMEKASD